jgi:hypothetical protein
MSLNVISPLETAIDILPQRLMSALESKDADVAGIVFLERPACTFAPPLQFLRKQVKQSSQTMIQSESNLTTVWYVSHSGTGAS